MATEKISSKDTERTIFKITDLYNHDYKVEIPLKLPSLNDLIHMTNRNRFLGAKLKRDTQRDISYFINIKPIEKPVKIHFLWVEGNQRRDLDNIASAKKFILDALVEKGVLQDDNHHYVKGFTDDFFYGNDFKVILLIEEMK